jgi:hypothetical protein
MNIETFVIPDPDDVQTRDEIEDLIQSFNTYFIAYMRITVLRILYCQILIYQNESILWSLEPDQIILWRQDRIKNCWMSLKECDAQEAVITRFLHYLFSILEVIREQQNDKEL